MLDRIASLNVKGCGLVFSEPSVMSAIILAASGMLADSKPNNKLKEKTFEGMISTNFDRGFIGGLGGVIFDISIESNYGATSMKFILFRPMSREEVEDCIFFMCPTEEFDTLNELMKQATQEASSAVQ